MTDLGASITTVLVDCLGLAADESLVVVTDPPRREIGDALVDRARRLGAEAVLMEMGERASHGTEPPPAVAAAMLQCNAVVAPTTKSLSHTEARHAACAEGVRIATMPQITDEVLLRTMSADYEEVKRRSETVAELLSAGTEVRITSREGTDLWLSLEGREGLADTGDLRAPGAFGNLPAGEGFAAPVEGMSRGVIVFDGTIAGIDELRSPLTVRIEEGYATAIEGEQSAELRALLEPYGREAFAVAELGIGTNEAARLSGNLLEDEKIMGTIHIALGDNHSFGGSIRVPSHIDGVVLRPTLTVDGEPVVEEGRLTI